MHACTIIARNYRAQARILAASFREHHPGARFSTLVIDLEPDAGLGEDEPFETVTPWVIGLDEAEFHRLAMIYDVMELATAVKPYLLQHLLTQSEEVMYLDPDIEVFKPLDDVFAAAREHAIALTPHTTEPMPHDDSEPGEVTLLLAGMFNLGFIAVGQGSAAFLDWWAERVARDCIVAPERGRFVDQRWVDFVPTLFDHAILRDPGLNVAHWNLYARRVKRSGNGYLVDGEPLRFFHYSGFDPEQPHLLSKFLGPSPSILLSEEPELAELCAAYAAQLLEQGFHEFSRVPYRYDTLPSGAPVNRRMRRLYRQTVVTAEREDGELPPDPFDPATAGDFVAWLNEPLGPGPASTRYLLDLHQSRADLQSAFPDPRWRDAVAFVEWVQTVGRAEEHIPFELVPDVPAPPPAPPAPAGFAEGINVAGYFRAELGVGEAARHLLAGIERAGLPYTTLTYDRTVSRQEHPFDEGAIAEPSYDVNVICVNADELPRFTWDMGPDFFADRYSIGVWWWEVSSFPERFRPALEIVDEVWVGSDFVRDAIQPLTERPVLTLPFGVELPSPVALSRSELRLPEEFVFLFSFDFDSVFERKNPLGLVEAFTRAFEPGEGPTLLLKSINGHRHLRDLERLRAATAGRDDIVITDAYVSSERRHALTAACDCYVSLHRSEGLGLTMVEAMAYGKPVIATGYSGNTTFMTPENSYLVPYALTPIPEGCEPYPAGADWADPDLEEAARLMRKVVDEPDDADARARRAREDVGHSLSSERTGEFVRDRLEEVRTQRRDEPPEEDPEPATPAERAERYVVEGPSVPLRAPSRLGVAGVFARRLLYRLLRPYLARHREFEVAVIDGLRSSTPLDVTEALQDQVRGVQEQLQEQGHRLETSLTWQFARQDERLDRLQEHLTRLDDVIRRHQADLAKHLGTLDAEAQTLSAQLRAVPYVADPALVRTRDDDAREVIGYHGAGGNGDGPEGVYAGFEDVFRGSEDFIRERQRPYLVSIGGRSPVLDVGCGRGEFLDLLAEAGIEATGVDLDPGMVARSRAKGHEVVEGDAVEVLAGRKDGEFGAIFSAQLIEHLPYETLLRFFELAKQKLAPGGVLIAETVNPHSIAALKTFWVDPTHRSPIFPEVAVALCRLHGYESAVVVFPNGSGELEQDLHREGEYAVVATRSVG